jgi:hypothetical protein
MGMMEMEALRRLATLAAFRRPSFFLNAKSPE